MNSLKEFTNRLSNNKATKNVVILGILIFSITLTGLLAINFPTLVFAADIYDFEIAAPTNGRTTDPVITIKARNSGACFDAVHRTIQLSNAGNGYKDTHWEEWTCVSGWSYLDWDLTSYDGNILYGLKTVYWRGYVQGEFYHQYGTRTILYEEDSPPPPPAPPPPASSGGSISNVTSPKPKALPILTPPPDLSDSTVNQPNEVVTEKPTDITTVAGTSAEKKDIPYSMVLIVILAAGLGFLIAKFKSKA